MKFVPPWKLKFWSLAHLDNLELLHASQITHDYPAHMHEDYSIAVILRGKEITTCRGVRHQATAGDVLLIDAEEVHSNRSVESEYRSIKVKRQTLQKITGELAKTDGEPHFPDVLVTDARLFQRLLKLHLKLEQKGSALEQESAFVSAMTYLCAWHCSEQIPQTKCKAESTLSENTPVHRVRDYLRSHYAENVSLSELSSLADLSPFYLLRVFHRGVGFPPHEYQTQVRIAHARKLIRRGVDLSQVALETGFFDQSHLSRNFKRIVGVTPLQYFHRKNSVDSQQSPRN